MIYLQFDESILNVDGSLPVDGAILERAANETLQYSGTPAGADLTIVLAGDARLQELNLQYLGMDAPTDVLSFPSGEIDPDSENIYLGDVVISYPRAQDQAAAGGHSLVDELRLLTVHGVLHLLGHDHAEKEEKAVMWSAQAEILAGLGSSITLPPF